MSFKKNVRAVYEGSELFSQKADYSNSESFSENLSNIKVPVSIFRQELVTWEYTENGIKRTTVVRNFSDNKHIDNYTSEPIAFKR